jgi:DEAD/DEAH box helicase domain-containing protein
VYLVKSDDRQKRTIPIVKTSIVNKSEKNAVNRDITPAKKSAQKISLRLGLIELDRTITGYLKGNYNDSADKFETHSGKSTPSWTNFNWKSKHSAVSLTLPPDIVQKKSNSDGKSPITLDSRIHTITHVLVNACKIITKSESNDIDSYYEDGVIYLYDNTSDGYNGCSKIIFDSFEDILQTSHSLLNDCDCPADKTQKQIVDAGGNWGGCPKCTFTTNYCQTKNKDLSKSEAGEFFSRFKHT